MNSLGFLYAGSQIGDVLYGCLSELGVLVGQNLHYLLPQLGLLLRILSKAQQESRKGARCLIGNYIEIIIN